jgi:hypothetical protein
MKLFLSTTLLSIAAVLALVTAAQAAGVANDLDPERRAKIAKAKAKMASEQAENFDFIGNGNGQKKADCGSQSIGNINLNRQAGTGPREIFVFAPDAINIVGPRGCQ